MEISHFKLLLAISAFGMKVEYIENNVLYISVPKKSSVHDDGEEVSGEYLAKRSVKVFAMLDKNIKVLYRIRDDEWTEEDVERCKEVIKEWLQGYKEV